MRRHWRAFYYVKAQLPASKLKQAILTVLQDYIEFLGDDPNSQLHLIVDEKNDHYLLLETGWQGEHRIYGSFIHLDIINNKIWIQHDGTEEGVALELTAQGIDKQQIVLGFKSLERRKITEYAIA
ncbi:MAG: XisI protein [Cyanobacteria bacterium J06592_8]